MEQCEPVRSGTARTTEIIHDAPPEATKSAPFGLAWRSSVWFITSAVGLGICTDVLVYTVIIPVLPFHLEKLGYKKPSSLVGYLLFAYSAGLVASTIPIAVVSEKYRLRRMPFLFGLLLLTGSQALFMEAPNYAVMCVARALQGVSSGVVWVVGLALLSDTVPEANVGQQIGAAMAGVALGLLLGQPMGGALYRTFGWRGPFLFGIICSSVDLIGRLLVIERAEALKWGHDPAASLTRNSSDNDCPPGAEAVPTGALEKSHASSQSALDVTGSTIGNPGEDTDIEVVASHKEGGLSAQAPLQKPPLSLPQVIIRLGTSPRALTACLDVFVIGMAFTTTEPTLPLHLQYAYGFNSVKVGIVSLAASTPTLLASPVAGWLSDHYGTAVVTVLSLLLTIPWWVTVAIPKSLALFIFSYGMLSFLITGLLTSTMTDLAAVAQGMDGIGFAHVYAMFNIAYGLGNAFGPLIGGQVYEHARHGWVAVCIINLGLCAAASLPAFYFAGPSPLIGRFFGTRSASRNAGSAETSVALGTGVSGSA